MNAMLILVQAVAQKHCCCAARSTPAPRSMCAWSSTRPWPRQEARRRIRPCRSPAHYDFSRRFRHRRRACRNARRRRERPPGVAQRRAAALAGLAPLFLFIQNAGL